MKTMFAAVLFAALCAVSLAGLLGAGRDAAVTVSLDNQRAAPYGGLAYGGYGLGLGYGGLGAYGVGRGLGYGGYGLGLGAYGVGHGIGLGYGGLGLGYGGLGLAHGGLGLAHGGLGLGLGHGKIW